jgi:uncharacterized protein (DUF736 family)
LDAAGKEKRPAPKRKDEVMKIGSFKFDERASDIIGKIATREMRFPYLIMRRVEDRQSDSAPVYEIYETNRAGDEIQIGVVWERRMKANDEVFLSGMVDDPSFREPLPSPFSGTRRTASMSSGGANATATRRAAASAIARAAASGRAVSADGRAAASPAAAPQAPVANTPATGAALTMRCPSKRHQGGPGSAGTLPGP